MPLAHLQSFAFVGIDATLIDVEVDISRPQEGKKANISICGLPDAAVREAKDRVLPAIRNAGFSPGDWDITVNLAPGDLKKQGALYDLPIALGILQASGIVQNTPLPFLVAGELGLNGELRPFQGALAMAILAKKMQCKGIFLPHDNKEEAAAIPGVPVVPLTDLHDAVRALNDPKPYTLTKSSQPYTHPTPEVDFSDIKGQQQAKRALEIAAAGRHNVLLFGPPGSGKSMLAKSLAGILPQLSLQEALDITKISAAAGTRSKTAGLAKQRPFRAPHHTTSFAGLIGGGSVPKPGEVSLAHQGVLFLDELPEFSRQVLEVMRQPLEDRYVTISRSLGRMTFPASFILIAAMNPCPCGYRGHPDKPCSCTDAMVQRYQNKISGPLLDRIDMHLETPALRYSDLAEKQECENSQEVQKRVTEAQHFAKKRQGKTPNAALPPRELKKMAPLGAESKSIMEQAIDGMGISVRAHDRILRVARTIADLEQSKTVKDTHLMEAISYRTPSM